MASVPSSQDMLISSFLDIAVDQTVDTAREFLQATNWNLEEAIQRFFSGNNNGGAAAAESFNYSPLIEDNPTLWESEDDDDVRLPLPVRREVLYGENSGLYEDEREQISSSTFDSYDYNTLSVLFRPPYELLYNGPFDHAKEAGAKRNRWLLVNVQSRSEFASDTLNRDTWANDIVAQMIENNFMFWQEGDHTEEGRKVCTYYKLDSRPVILVIDPLTGQKMRSWNGMVQPETLLEDAMTFIDRTPSEYHSDLLRKQLERLTHLDRIEEGTEEKEKEITSEDENDQNELLMNTNTIYLPLPEEPNRSLISNCDKNLVCRIAIRLPDGRRIQRNFMKSDPIKLLWSFCSTQFEEAKAKAFRFRQAMPGPTKFWASNFWTCDSNLTFEESGLDNSVIALVMI